MLVLVTGSTGFVGSALCPLLVSKGLAVIAISRRRFDEQPTLPDSAYRPLSIQSIDGTTNWDVALAGVDVVVHCAARVHVMNDTDKDPLSLYRMVNVEGTLNLARQAASAGVKRFIFLSSIKVNGESTQGRSPFNADEPPNPGDPYGQSKLEAEKGLFQIGHETGMEIVIIRPPLIYGPGVKANFASMMRWVRCGVPLPLGAATKNRRSLLGLGNLTDLIHTCLTHPAAANQVFLASDDKDLSTSELLRAVGQVAGRPVRLIYLPQTIARIITSMVGREGLYDRLFGSLQVDIGKTKSLLNWTAPYSVEEGLRSAYQASNKITGSASSH